jgi:hypothetical protein
VESVAGDLVGRLVGGLILGFAIGLMVAVVEAAFRRAWLEVRYGARETITVTLGPEPVKIGGDAKVCTVWARGASPIALRFFIRDGQVICHDVADRRESTVPAGHEKHVGNVTVIVHTSAATASLPPPRPAPAAPPLSAEEDFVLPMPIRQSPPPSPKPAAPPLSLDDEPLPPPPPPKPASPSLAKPPVPVAQVVSRPAPPAPKHTATAKPQAAVVGEKHADACPGCGRVNTGRAKQRYCMVCDATY